MRSESLHRAWLETTSAMLRVYFRYLFCSVFFFFYVQKRFPSVALKTDECLHFSVGMPVFIRSGMCWFDLWFSDFLNVYLYLLLFVFLL